MLKGEAVQHVFSIGLEVKKKFTMVYLFDKAVAEGRVIAVETRSEGQWKVKMKQTATQALQSAGLQTSTSTKHKFGWEKLVILI